MDIMLIIYIIVAFIAGAIVAYLLKKGNKPVTDTVALQNLSTENETLKAQLADAENKIKAVDSDASKKADEIRTQYDALLKEANAQCDELNRQLQNALEGKIDDSLKEQLAAAEKLKKKIKDLEEELEEAEDDLSDTKKKLKNKDADIAELQDNYSKEQKKAAELTTELSAVKDALEEKVEELKLKMGSLDFVQEILSAPEASTDDVRKLYGNIAEVKSFALGQLMDCYATLKDNYINFGDGDFNAYKKSWQERFYGWASVTKKSWINGKTTIAFVGEFSAGKTSIVNRILSQDEPNVPKLPVSTKATTAIATYIAGGPAVSYQFVTPDDRLKSISQQTFTEKVSKEVLDQVKGISSLIQYFVMTYKNPHLNGLSILDTPGFNSNDKNDAKRTMEVINECDALFWVFDVNAGTVNRSSIDIIKKYLNKPLYVVINKVDTKSDSEVQKVENLIRKTLNDEGLTVEAFIRFSAKAPLSTIMTPIKNVQHLTEKEQYLTDLGDSIDGILKILEEDREEANKEYQKAEQEGERITNRYVEQMKILFNHCNTAASIPQYSEHIFKKDNYEMSQSEYERLCNILDQSCSEVEIMAEIYDEKSESASKAQLAWSNVCEAKAAWQRVNDMKNQFTKLQKKF